jgi:hypothetical protein
VKNWENAFCCAGGGVFAIAPACEYYVDKIKEKKKAKNPV